MATIKSDIEGGFNAFIAYQRTQPGRCTVTLADFSSPGDYVVRYAAKDLSTSVAPPLYRATSSSTCAGLSKV